MLACIMCLALKEIYLILSQFSFVKNVYRRYQVTTFEEG